jgi:hypothetical protein
MRNLDRGDVDHTAITTLSGRVAAHERAAASASLLYRRQIMLFVGVFP